MAVQHRSRDGAALLDDDEGHDDPLLRGVGLVRLEAYCAGQKLRIQRWLDRQRSAVESRAEAHRLLARGERSAVEGARRALAALESDVAATEDDEDEAEGGGGGGAAGRYEEEQRLVRDDIDRLHRVAEEKKAEIHGTAPRRSGRGFFVRLFVWPPLVKSQH
jgi:hypothetical protein